MTIEAVDGSFKHHTFMRMILTYVVGDVTPNFGVKLPQVQVTNPRGDMSVVSVLNTWEEAVAEAERLIQELYDDGVEAFCEKHRLPKGFEE